MAKVGKDGELKILLEDYPYAEDGMLIWNALKRWNDGYLVGSPTAFPIQICSRELRVTAMSACPDVHRIIASDYYPACTLLRAWRRDCDPSKKSFSRHLYGLDGVLTCSAPSFTAIQTAGHITTAEAVLQEGQGRGGRPGAAGMVGRDQDQGPP